MVETLIARLRDSFAKVADPRNGANTQFSFVDIAASAFSAFFMQSPSFLDHQRVFQSAHGKNACGSLFGVTRLPTDTHIRAQLDRVKSCHFYAGFDIALDQLKQYQALEPFQTLGGRTLIALDGSEFHNSRKVHCKHCQHRVKNKGTDEQYVEYYHSVLAAVAVGLASAVAVPLRPEFITPHDGDNKQDCETKAAYRWLDANAARYAKLRPIYLGDDLYAKQPMCRKIIANGDDFIFNVKESDHAILFDYLHGITWPSKRQCKKTPGRHKPNKEYRYRWTHCKLPLGAEKNPFQAYYVEVRIRDTGPNAKANSKPRTFRYITSIAPDKDNVVQIVRCGRTRWRCENEGFNLLKKGYHAEHNFGHGKKGLSNTLLTLNLIAFAFHGVCDLLCQLWFEARRQCFRRKRFFLLIDAITSWTYFRTWRELLAPIANPDLRPIAQAPP